VKKIEICVAFDSILSKKKSIHNPPRKKNSG
jgi:hypothetical protein